MTPDSEAQVAPGSLTTPVLLIGFNRPEAMAAVLDRIRQARPERLFIAVDGPRPDRAGEEDRVQACRDLAQRVDWPCEVQTLFQENNLGCGRGVSTAISWFFHGVEEGIILEDDVVPARSFFDFCTELLERYRYDERVFAISGCNLVPRTRLSEPDAPYRFSQIPTIWGWATWRRSWAQYRLDISDWRTRLRWRTLLTRLGGSPSSAAFWGSEFELTGRGNIDTWDWQLTCAAMTSGQLTATSNVNLVENIGFGHDATHTTADGPSMAPPRSLDLPTSPQPVVADRMADRWATTHHFGGSLLTTADRLRQYVQSGRRVNAPWV